MYKTYLDIDNIFLFYRLTGPRWKGEFLLVPIGIEFCSTDPGGGAKMDLSRINCDELLFQIVAQK